MILNQLDILDSRLGELESSLVRLPAELHAVLRPDTEGQGAAIETPTSFVDCEVSQRLNVACHRLRLLKVSTDDLIDRIALNETDEVAPHTLGQGLNANSKIHG